MARLTAVLIAILLSSSGYALDNIEHWQEDIDFYASHLVEGHIDPFHTLAKADFDEEVLRIKRGLAHKSEDEVLVELMRLTRRVNDGHTSFPLWGREQAWFPLRFKLFGEHLYVVGATEQYKKYLGAKLVSINDMPALEILSALAEICPFTENEYSTAIRAAEYLPNASVLNGLGIVKSGERARFVLAVMGATSEVQLSPSLSPKFNARISHLNDHIFKAHEKVNDDLWYGSSVDNKTVYLKFRRYTSIVKMEKFARELLDFINDHHSENLIIDLRDNYGGDFFVGLKLAQSLVLADSINWRSGVYTLIDSVTFSAAMSNAAQFSQILNSKLVGVPTGAKPSGYQDMGQFTLPNSKLAVTFSKRLYHFKEDHRDALYPDVRVETPIEDYINGYDRQLRWVLRDISTD